MRHVADWDNGDDDDEDDERDDGEHDDDREHHDKDSGDDDEFPMSSSQPRHIGASSQPSKKMPTHWASSQHCRKPTVRSETYCSFR